MRADRLKNKKAGHDPVPAGVGLIHDCAAIDPRRSPSEDIPYALVDYHRLKPEGVRITNNWPLEKGIRTGFMAYDQNEAEWKSFRATVTRRLPQAQPDDGYTYELAFDVPEAAGMNAINQDGAAASDLAFLLRSAALENIPPSALFHLINCMQRRTYHGGDHLYSQGEAGQSLFLIQEGICAIKVSKDGQTHHVSRLKRGEVCGELAILTGEVHSEYAVAETDMTVWALRQKAFDQVARLHPDLRIFLTEILTQRLASWSYKIDRTVGKYTIKQPIGSGGWGIVYRGHHRALNMPVAVKMLKHDMAMEPLFLETFRSEARVIARLNHPNIVQVFDVDEIYRTIFIIMEYLEGEPLRATLERCGSLSVLETVDYLQQILDGLKYAHEQGIVHRDVKPENIFLLPDGRIKILDFGLAAPAGVKDLNLQGTVHYASPEQIEGEPEDARSDIYAVGIMAYEFLCGRRPYPEDDLGRLMELHCTQTIPDPAETIPDLPENLRQFILRCCAIDPAQRYASAGEALAVIEEMARQLRIQTEQEKRLLTSVVMIYPEKNRQALRRLLEKFSHEIEDLEIVMKISETTGI